MKKTYTYAEELLDKILYEYHKTRIGSFEDMKEQLVLIVQEALDNYN